MSALFRPTARRWLRAGVALGATGVVLLAALPAEAGDDQTNNTSSKLRAAVTPQGVAEHLKALDAIASANGGTRASGTPGFTASRDYVVGVLEKAGYRPQVQEFEFPFFRELAPAQLSQLSPQAKTYANPDDFTAMTYSGSGTAEGQVVAVDTDLTPVTTTPSTSGCEASDFDGFPAGAIALIQRGSCTFGTKALNAEQHGAVGVVIFNSGAPGATGSFAGTLGAPDVTVPVVGASFAMGPELAGTTSRLVTSTESEFRTTWNVTAETAKGDPNNVVMAGAHLDSVVPGPGINDNGSGSATILEVAEQMAKTTPMNKVRFAWWGAEELGLLGSEHYVDSLPADDLKALALYLNFDMIGSPNYVRFVYDGNNSRYPVGPGAAEGPAGSGAIEQLFHNYFGSQSLASEETPFSGRSDYGPFIAEGVPAGGLFTGAEGVKTEAQALTYGGQAGVAYDACYHRACDGIGNVNMTAVDEMSDAVAHAVLTYAMSTKTVNGSMKGHPVSAPDHGETGSPTGSGTQSGGGLHDDHDELLSS